METSLKLMFLDVWWYEFDYWWRYFPQLVAGLRCFHEFSPAQMTNVQKSCKVTRCRWNVVPPEISEPARCFTSRFLSVEKWKISFRGHDFKSLTRLGPLGPLGPGWPIGVESQQSPIGSLNPVQLSILSTWKIQLVMVHQCQHPHRSVQCLEPAPLLSEPMPCEKRPGTGVNGGLGLGRDPVVLGFVDFNDFKGSFFYIVLFIDISWYFYIDSNQINSNGKWLMAMYRLSPGPCWPRVAKARRSGQRREQSFTDGET